MRGARGALGDRPLPFGLAWADHRAARNNWRMEYELLIAQIKY